MASSVLAATSASTTASSAAWPVSKKNNAYNGIMREYFHTTVEDRSKFFGLTASLIWNPNDAVKSFAPRGRDLEAKIIAVETHVEEVLDHSPKPAEVSCYMLYILLRR